MTNEPTKQTGVPPTYSSGIVTSDDTIVELIYNSTARKTAFAASCSGEVTIQESFVSEDGTKLLPIPSTNNLIRHRAVLLPAAPLPYESTTQLLAEIRRYIAAYVELSPGFLVVASAYVLFSWVYDAFNELPYLRFRGDFGSGKTRALSVVGSLVYKGFFASGASTISPIFYTLDAFRGTLVIDEADFRFSDKDSDVVKILNSGNVNGFPVLRQSVNQRREFDPRAFQVFGPKIVAMRHAFDDAALESRFLTEEMGQRTPDNDIPLNLPPEQADEAATLRAKLLMYRLKERNSVGIIPELVDATRAARMNQVLVPLLSVIPTEAERRAVAEVATRLDKELLLDRGDTPEGTVLRILVSMFRDEQAASIRIVDVADALTKSVGLSFDRTITPKYVGYLIRKRLHLSTHKSHGNYVIGRSEHETVLVLGKRYGVLDDN